MTETRANHALPTHQWLRLPPESGFTHRCPRCGTYRSKWSSDHCWTPSPLALKLMEQLRLRGLRCSATQHKVRVWPNKRRRWGSTQEFDARYHDTEDIARSMCAQP